MILPAQLERVLDRLVSIIKPDRARFSWSIRRRVR